MSTLLVDAKKKKQTVKNEHTHFWQGCLQLENSNEYVQRTDWAKLLDYLLLSANQEDRQTRFKESKSRYLITCCFPPAKKTNKHDLKRASHVT